MGHELKEIVLEIQPPSLPSRAWENPSWHVPSSSNQQAALRR